MSHKQFASIHIKGYNGHSGGKSQVSNGSGGSVGQIHLTEVPCHHIRTIGVAIVINGNRERIIVECANLCDIVDT